MEDVKYVEISRRNVENCSFPRWKRYFEGILSWKCVLIPVDPNFEVWLKSDNFVLPAGEPNGRVSATAEGRSEGKGVQRSRSESAGSGSSWSSEASCDSSCPQNPRYGDDFAGENSKIPISNANDITTSGTRGQADSRAEANRDSKAEGNDNEGPTGVHIHKKSMVQRQLKSWELLHANIKKAFNELGGTVLPRLAWNFPQDSTWIIPSNSLECTSVNEIYLLLKSSDILNQDLELIEKCQASLSSSSQTLSVSIDAESCPIDKEFFSTLCLSVGEDMLYETDSATLNPTDPINCIGLITPIAGINPSLEFRCFVYQNRLIAVSQRYPEHRIPLQILHSLNQLSAKHPDYRAYILYRTDKFLRFNLLPCKFPESCYTFDVAFVHTSSSCGVNKIPSICLLNVNPWAPFTDPLALTWREIEFLVSTTKCQANSHSPPIPIVKINDSTFPEPGSSLPFPPTIAAPFPTNRLPLDIVNASEHVFNTPNHSSPVPPVLQDLVSQHHDAWHKFATINQQHTL